MKTILISLLLLFVSQARAEFCDWGFVGPKIYRCDDQNYYYGTAACRTGFYSNIFCNSKYSQDGKACADDDSPETIKCYNRMNKIYTHSDKKNSDLDDGWPNPNKKTTPKGER
jgi:hypothetical protein